MLNVSLHVTYTHGKPVNGFVYFRFKIKKKEGYYEIDKGTKNFQLRNGTFESCFSVEPCRNPYNVSFPTRLLVEATVTDLATGLTESAVSARTVLDYSPYQISLQNTINVYRPNVTNYIAVSGGSRGLDYYELFVL